MFILHRELFLLKIKENIENIHVKFFHLRGQLSRLEPSVYVWFFNSNRRYAASSSGLIDMESYCVIFELRAQIEFIR
jgi:hypothetical protein